MLLRLLVALAFLAPTAAAAEWREATTRHFVIYSESGEKSLREAAADLELFDHLLRQVTQAPAEGPSKLKVYLMRSYGSVQQVGGYPSGSAVAGFYTASSRGPIAVGVRTDTSADMAAQAILFHEYAHHLMLQHFPAAYPTWYTEGFAEYYGATKVLENSTVELGIPAAHRYYSLRSNRWLQLKSLLTAKSYRDVGGDLDLLYAQGWLLTHYLSNSVGRKGQLRTYLGAINGGAGFAEAMEKAFGKDAAALNSELRAYARRPRLEALRITFKEYQPAPVTVRTLSPAEQKMVKHDIALARGIRAREAARFAADVRDDAENFAADPAALSILAEAERLAGNRDAASAAVERWLKARPGAPRALMLKGLLAAEALAAAGSTDSKAWDAARQPIAEARKATPKDPMIMEAFYDAHAMQGRMPPGRAQNALFYAFERVPQDPVLRQKVATDFERRGMIAEAIAAIRPLAFTAHAPETDPKKKAKQDKELEKYRLAGETLGETPYEMLERLEAKLAAAPPSSAEAGAE